MPQREPPSAEQPKTFTSRAKGSLYKILKLPFVILGAGVVVVGIYTGAFAIVNIASEYVKKHSGGRKKSFNDVRAGNEEKYQDFIEDRSNRQFERNQEKENDKKDKRKIDEIKTYSPEYARKWLPQSIEEKKSYEDAGKIFAQHKESFFSLSKKKKLSDEDKKTLKVFLKYIYTEEWGDYYQHSLDLLSDKDLLSVAREVLGIVNKKIEVNQIKDSFKQSADQYKPQNTKKKESYEKAEEEVKKYETKLKGDDKVELDETSKTQLKQFIKEHCVVKQGAESEKSLNKLPDKDLLLLAEEVLGIVNKKIEKAKIQNIKQSFKDSANEYATIDSNKKESHSEAEKTVSRFTKYLGNNIDSIALDEASKNDLKQFIKEHCVKEQGDGPEEQLNMLPDKDLLLLAKDVLGIVNKKIEDKARKEAEKRAKEFDEKIKKEFAEEKARKSELDLIKSIDKLTLQDFEITEATKLMQLLSAKNKETKLQAISDFMDRSIPKPAKDNAQELTLQKLQHLDEDQLDNVCNRILAKMQNEKESKIIMDKYISKLNSQNPQLKFTKVLFKCIEELETEKRTFDKKTSELHSNLNVYEVTLNHSKQEVVLELTKLLNPGKEKYFIRPDGDLEKLSVDNLIKLSKVVTEKMQRQVQPSTSTIPTSAQNAQSGKKFERGDDGSQLARVSSVSSQGGSKPSPLTTSASANSFGGSAKAGGPQGGGGNDFIGFFSENADNVSKSASNFFLAGIFGGSSQQGKGGKGGPSR